MGIETTRDRGEIEMMRCERDVLVWLHSQKSQRELENLRFWLAVSQFKRHLNSKGLNSIGKEFK